MTLRKAQAAEEAARGELLGKLDDMLVDTILDGRVPDDSLRAVARARAAHERAEAELAEARKAEAEALAVRSSTRPRRALRDSQGLD